MAEALIQMAKVLRSVTINVRVQGLPIAKARLWAGAQVVKLAALIMGCNIEIEAEIGTKTAKNTTV